MASRKDPVSPSPAVPKPGFAEEALPHLDAVFRFAIRLCAGQADEAEDVVQDTFLRAYRAWDTYQRGTNCRSWLFTICRNVFLRRRESAGRRPETPMSRFDVRMESLPVRTLFEDAHPSDPEHEFFDSFIDGEVARAIDTLPSEFREVVTLSDVQGLSYAEIAGILAVPLGTVKSRLFRARRLLQEQLYGYAVESGYIRPRPSGGQELLPESPP